MTLDNLLHRAWSEARDSPDYCKETFLALERAIQEQRHTAAILRKALQDARRDAETMRDKPGAYWAGWADFDMFAWEPKADSEWGA